MSTDTPGAPPALHALRRAIRLPVVTSVLLSLLASLAAQGSEPDRKMKRHALGKTMNIDLPRSWRLVSTWQPDVGKPNYRVQTGRMVVEIEGLEIDTFTFPGMKPTLWSLDENLLRSSNREAAAPWILKSAEKKLGFVRLSGAGWVGSLTTLSAPGSAAAFTMLDGSRRACLTFAEVRSVAGGFAFSIASDDCGGRNHLAAIAALSTVRIEEDVVGRLAANANAAMPPDYGLPDEDFDAVVAAVLTQKDVAMYLHPEVPGRVPVRVFFLPPDVGRLPNVDLYGHRVEMVATQEDRGRAVNLGLDCKPGSCTAHVSYRPEGIHGQVTVKFLDGKWQVEDARILE